MTAGSAMINFLTGSRSGLLSFSLLADQTWELGNQDKAFPSLCTCVHLPGGFDACDSGADSEWVCNDQSWGQGG